MKTLLKTIALSTALSLPLMAQADSYTVDPSHSFSSRQTIWGFQSCRVVSTILMEQ